MTPLDYIRDYLPHLETCKRVRWSTENLPCTCPRDEAVAWVEKIAEAAGNSRCRASRGDGECSWQFCPQLRDNEPEITGRHCPLDTLRPDEDW